MHITVAEISCYGCLFNSPGNATHFILVCFLGFTYSVKSVVEILYFERFLLFEE